jgi:hypothetical protein
MILRWHAVQNLYSPEPLEWLARVQELGLEWPLDVFEPIFIDHHDDDDFAATVQFIDWNTIEWSEQRLSGRELRQVVVPRGYQLTVDEARARTIAQGFHDDREEVMARWQEAKTWMRSPIVMAGALFQSAARYELIVGFTRLGNMLGALDRQDLPETSQHMIWLGQEA